VLLYRGLRSSDRLRAFSAELVHLSLLSRGVDKSSPEPAEFVSRDRVSPARSRSPALPVCAAAQKQALDFFLLSGFARTCHRRSNGHRSDPLCPRILHNKPRRSSSPIAHLPRDLFLHDLLLVARRAS
jgi:hypothetical protein